MGYQPALCCQGPPSNVPIERPGTWLGEQLLPVVASFQKLELWIHFIWEAPVYVNVDSTPVCKIYTEGQRKMYPKPRFAPWPIFNPSHFSKLSVLSEPSHTTTPPVSSPARPF